MSATCYTFPKCCVPLYSYSAEQAPPVVSSATIPVTAGEPFSYQITATNYPLSYVATNLPMGVTIDIVTGIISGTVSTGPATIVTNIYATNNGGTGAGTLTLDVGVAVNIQFNTGPLFFLAGVLTVSLDGGAFIAVSFDPDTGQSAIFGATHSIVYKIAIADGTYTDGLTTLLESTIGATLLAGSSITYSGNLTAGSIASGFDCYLTTGSGQVGPSNASLSMGAFGGTVDASGITTGGSVFDMDPTGGSTGSITTSDVSAMFVLKF